MNLRILLTGILLLAATVAVQPVAARDAVHSAAPAKDSHATTASHAAGAAHDEKHAAGAHGDAHGEEAHESSGTPELPNFVSLILDAKIDGKKVSSTHAGHILHEWEKQVFLIIVLGLSALLFSKAASSRSMKPGKLQTLLELMHQGFFSFFGGIIGEKHIKYVPFLGSVFMFIWFNNLIGLIPGFAPATSVYPTTLAMALAVFTYVQIQGIREGGLKHYLMHFLGSPQDFAGVVIGVCLLPLEIIGFFAKPLSLSLRLFGNIMGEDILIGVFLIMGLMLMGVVWPDPWIGVPLHTPFLFLGLLTSTVQALVFTLLSSIYLLLLLPHEHHDEQHHYDEHAEGAANDEGLHISGGEISPV